MPDKFYEILEILIYIAVYGKGKAVKCADICKYKKLSLRYLESDLKLLVKYHLLKATTGPKGGYMLNLERRKIMPDSIYKVALLLHNKKETHKTALYKDIISPIEKTMQETILNRLKLISFDDLCMKYESNSTALKHDDLSNFSI